MIKVVSRYRRAVASIIIAGLLISVAIALAGVALSLNHSMAEINKASLEASKRSIKALSEELRLVSDSEVSGYCNVKYFVVKDPRKESVTIIHGITVNGYAKLPPEVSEAIAKGYEVKAVTSTGRVFLLSPPSEPRVGVESGEGIVIPRLVAFSSFNGSYSCLLVNSNEKVSFARKPGVYAAYKVIIGKLLFEGEVQASEGIVYEFKDGKLEVVQRVPREAVLSSITPRAIGNLWKLKLYPIGRTVRIEYALAKTIAAKKVSLSLHVASYYKVPTWRGWYPAIHGAIEIYVNGKLWKRVESRHHTVLVRINKWLKPDEDKLVIEIKPVTRNRGVALLAPATITCYAEPFIVVPKGAVVIVDSKLAEPYLTIDDGKLVFKISNGKHYVMIFETCAKARVDRTTIVDLVNGIIIQEEGEAKVIVPQVYLQLYGLSSRARILGAELASINGSTYLPLCKRVLEAEVQIGRNAYEVKKIAENVGLELKNAISAKDEKSWWHAASASCARKFTIISWSRGYAALRVVGAVEGSSQGTALNFNPKYGDLILKIYPKARLRSVEVKPSTTITVQVVVKVNGKVVFNKLVASVNKAIINELVPLELRCGDVVEVEVQCTAKPSGGKLFWSRVVEHGILCVNMHYISTT